MEDTDEIFVCPALCRTYQDTVSVVLVENKQLLITSVEVKSESSIEVGCYPLLVINNIGEDVVGTCLQYFHKFAVVWGGALGLGILDFLPDLFHVVFCSVHGRR